MNKFYQAVAKVLEVGAVGYDTDFRAVDGWCSLQAFGLLVLMENDYGVRLDIGRFGDFRTVGELYREAFLEFAARVLKVPRERLTPETAHGSIPEWDSVNHLRLVMEAERVFGVRYPLETIPGLKTLSDFLLVQG